MSRYDDTIIIRKYREKSKNKRRRRRFFDTGYRNIGLKLWIFGDILRAVEDNEKEMRGKEDDEKGAGTACDQG